MRLRPLKQTEADIQYWKATVETARINLKYTSVNCPHLRPDRKIQCDGGRPGNGQSAHAPFYHSTTGSHVCGCAPIHDRTAALSAPSGGRPAQPKRADPEQGPSPPGRRHQISPGRGASIPRRHGRSDDRIGHSADCLSQSEGRSAAGYVRPGGRGRGSSIPRPS